MLRGKQNKNKFCQRSSLLHDLTKVKPKSYSNQTKKKYLEKKILAGEQLEYYVHYQPESAKPNMVNSIQTSD